MDDDLCVYCGHPTNPLTTASLESLERGTPDTGGGWYVTLHVDDLELLEWVRR
jgi:hypothetical protein